MVADSSEMNVLIFSKVDCQLCPVYCLASLCITLVVAATPRDSTEVPRARHRYSRRSAQAVLQLPVFATGAQPAASCWLCPKRGDVEPGTLISLAVQSWSCTFFCLLTNYM